MLAKKNRIPRDIFNQVFKKTTVFYSDHLAFRQARNHFDLNNRFSFVIPKTVAKKAVGRNLIRRRGYSILRQNLKNIEKPNFGIFLAKKGLAEISHKKLEAEILFLLQKAKILIPTP